MDVVGDSWQRHIEREAVNSFAWGAYMLLYCRIHCVYKKISVR